RQAQRPAELEGVLEADGLRIGAHDRDAGFDRLQWNGVLSRVHTYGHVQARRQRGLEKLMGAEAATATALLDRRIRGNFLSPVRHRQPVRLREAARAD